MRSRTIGILIAVAAVAACREQPPPRLAQALAVGGTTSARARAFMTVAVSGPAGERREAALLWGLYACDAGSATAAVQAFSVARPEAGLGMLAARRLEEALSRGGGSPALWQRAAASPWLSAEERAELRVSAAERFVGAVSDEWILGVLPQDEQVSASLRLRALAVRGRLGGEPRLHALRRAAREFPHRFQDLFPGEDERAVVASLTTAEKRERAAALLAAGRASAALREASALGDAGAETAARAALELRRPRTAERWARRLGDSPAGLLLLAEAERQRAWSAPPASRAAAFGRMATTAARVGRVATADGSIAEAVLLRAEAATEMGSYAEAATLLANPKVQPLPRWEWVWRRLLFLQGLRGKGSVGAELASVSGSNRGRRLAAYWQAMAASDQKRSERLTELADSGFPDLPALWAARELGRTSVAVELSDGGITVSGPPAWADHLLTLGRVSDVIVAWRAELASGAAQGDEWISLVQLAGYPTIDAVPLLLRGEPRLLVGPWSGLPRQLLEAYLPLPWRAEVEAAARTADMPPWVLAGIVRQESAWNARARSPAGALGLTQVLPSTAPDIARWSGRKDLIGRNLFDPAVNLTLGALHTAGWFRDYRSWTVALACHNAGERRIRDAWLAAGRSDGPEFVESLEIPETWDYVHRVVLWSEGYRLLYWPDGEAYPWT